MIAAVLARIVRFLILFVVRLINICQALQMQFKPAFKCAELGLYRTGEFFSLRLGKAHVDTLLFKGLLSTLAAEKHA